MPNWCENVVEITATKEDVEHIANSLYDGEGLLSVLYPETHNGDWYNWRCNNWHCKWDVHPDILETGYSNKEASMRLRFDSAWSPPTGAYAHWIGQQEGRKIFALYYEPGCSFAGIWDNEGDTVYTVSSITTAKRLPAELDSAFDIVQQYSELTA